MTIREQDPTSRFLGLNRKTNTGGCITVTDLRPVPYVFTVEVSRLGPSPVIATLPRCGIIFRCTPLPSRDSSEWYWERKV